MRASLVILLTAIACSNDNDENCDLDYSDYQQSTYQEPTSGSGTPADLSVDDDDTFTSQYWFPDAANAGDGARTYWLTGDEDVAIDAEFALGDTAGDEWFGLDLNVVVLVNGAQVAFALDGNDAALTQTFTVRGAAGVFHHHIAIAHEAIPAGASNATITYLSSLGNDFGSWDFTLLKDGTQFPSKSSIAADVQKRTGSETVVDTDTGDTFDSDYVSIDASGVLHLSIPVRAAWTGCSQLTRSYAIAAILDGIVVALTGDQEAPVPHVDVDGVSTATFQAELTGLPVDGAAHSLSIFQFMDGAYWEAPIGSLSPLPDSGVVIGHGAW